MEEQILKTETPKWLKRIQENSWEAEILISGGAIFSLVKSSDFITIAGVTFKENYPFQGLDEILVWLTLAISWLTIGFIIHLFFRGFWVALVCLNSAFPQGIQTERLPVSEDYKGKARTYSLSRHIVRIDELSGLIFFCSIIFSLFAVGTVIHGWVTFTVASFVDDVRLLYWVIVGMFVMHYLDFFTSGILLRSKILGRFYKPFYVIGNYISLGFLYREPLQILVTNFGRVRLLFFLLSLSVLSLFVSYESLRTVLRLEDFFARHAYPASDNKNLYGDNFYMDRVSDRVDWIAVQTDLVTDHYLKVFIPYRPSYDEAIEKLKVDSFNKAVRIEINKIPADSLLWYNYRFKKTNQKGIIAYIPIEHLPKGQNEITLFIDSEYLTKRFPSITVPFWKD